MEDCIFCKIVKGEIPSHKIYEDNEFLIFLDVNPKAEGHMLVIPKEHYVNIFDIPEEVLKNLIAITQKLAKKLKQSSGVDGINILHASDKSAQQSVFHFHIHLIPRYENDGLDMWPKNNYEKSDMEVIQNKFKRMLD